MRSIRDDSHVVHLASRINFNGYESLCGDNGQNVTVGRRVIRIYGGAKRAMDPSKVNCEDCLRILGEVPQTLKK